MLRMVRGLGLIVSCGVALAALTASAVHAATQAATTLPATGVTSTSATLNGSVDTGGQAAEWLFQYGTGSAHGQLTPIASVPAGIGTVKVSSPITNLSPNTTYHFRLVVFSGIGTPYYTATAYGADLTFTTSPTGKLLLLSRNLVVFKGKVTVRLRCNSGVACNGSFAIVARVSVLCASSSFSIPARKVKKVRGRVSRACVAQLRNAPNHRIKPTLFSSTGSGQVGLAKPVTLNLF
jgi:hypothetical protein